MKKTEYTGSQKTQYIHVALDLPIKEKLDAATGRFSMHSKTGLVNALLQRYFSAVENGDSHMQIP